MTDPLFDPDHRPWCFEHCSERPLGSLSCDDEYASDRPCRWTPRNQIPGQLALDIGDVR